MQRKKNEFQTAASCSLQIGAVSALRRMSVVRRVPVVVMQSDPNRLATYAVAGIIWADHRAITAFTKDGLKECGAVCWGGNVELVSMRIWSPLYNGGPPAIPLHVFNFSFILPLNVVDV